MGVLPISYWWQTPRKTVNLHRLLYRQEGEQVADMSKNTASQR
jgi:hypothetical protein